MYGVSSGSHDSQRTGGDTRCVEHIQASQDPLRWIGILENPDKPTSTRFGGEGGIGVFLGGASLTCQLFGAVAVCRPEAANQSLHNSLTDIVAITIALLIL